MSERPTHVIGRCGGTIAAASFAAILHVLALDKREPTQLDSLGYFVMAFFCGVAVFCAIEADQDLAEFPQWRPIVGFTFAGSAVAFGFGFAGLIEAVNDRGVLDTTKLAMIVFGLVLVGSVVTGRAFGPARPHPTHVGSQRQDQ